MKTGRPRLDRFDRHANPRSWDAPFWVSGFECFRDVLGNVQGLVHRQRTALETKSAGTATLDRLTVRGDVTRLNIRVKGRWTHLYRAVDKHGRTVDVLLS
jgi:hypothetical protein